VWRPMWLHFEKPPIGLGRFVWLRWIERKIEYRLPPVSAEQDELDRRLRIIRCATGVAFAALLLLAGLLLSGARAADLRCPPTTRLTVAARYWVRTGGRSTGAGPGEAGLIGDSGWLGVTTAPASFTAWNVVPGGLCGGRLSMIRLVWSTRSKIAIETVATIAAINAGFRNARSIPVNASAGPEFRLDHAARSGKTVPPPVAT
jgi:hypothetical protein